MPSTRIDRRRPLGLALDVPELRLPLSAEGAAALPELSAGDGPSPFAFRFLVPVPATGGVLPADVGYDEDTAST